MKNFRSSKNLKPMDPQLKQQCQLRMKIKILQEQVALLQKSNLNIFIPLSEHPVHDTVDYQSIINKLRQQILSLEQQNQNVKKQNKKLEKQKQEQRIKYERDIQQLKSKNKQLQAEVERIQSDLDELQSQYQSKVKQCQELDKLIIQKNVQLKFVHEDLHEQRIKKQSIQKQLKDIKAKISDVIFGSRVYKSQEIKCICLPNSQYEELKAKIAELEAKIRSMIDASKREKITLGARKNDVGEEIVRLKKNIDAQLGLEGNSKHSEQFLKLYKGTNELINQLIYKYQR